MRITDWPTYERPREKLLEHGAQALSTAELLAIFLRTGSPGKTAVDLGRALLVQFGSLQNLLCASYPQCKKAHGIGTAKYCQLQAILELSRRYLRETVDKTTLTSTEQTHEYLQMRLQHHTKEVFACLFLDTKHQIIAFEELFHGTLNRAPIYLREVIQRVLTHNAAAVVFAHNHPSGIAEPSYSDQHITKRLIHALKMIEVEVLDHIVVGNRSPVSMASRGLMQPAPSEGTA